MNTGQGLTNSEYSFEEFIIDGPFSNTTQIRIRAISDQASDYFFFEDIKIESCGAATNSGPNCVVGQSCNDNDPCTVNDRLDASCNCVGIFQDSDGAGICDSQDSINGSCFAGRPCNDNDPCTVSD